VDAISTKTVQSGVQLSRISTGISAVSAAGYTGEDTADMSS
jgi:hypothetical protein